MTIVWRLGTIMGQAEPDSSTIGLQIGFGCMDTDQEQALIRDFIHPDGQERHLQLLTNPERRDHVRPACTDDLSALRELIPHSVRALSRGFYTPTQIESAIRYVFGPDTQLIADGTYYVAEVDGRIVGCGGWSRRRTLYGGDQRKGEEDPLLDPATEAARIRAFFVHPDWTRQGVASQIMAGCVEAARAAGFQRLELMATLPGEPLYQAFGFEGTERVEILLPDGVHIPFVRMARRVVSAM